uniref:Uncharacterized protein n=1 Tax=Lotus japonicus TaxID=34305 RepID=I3SKM4_LOTJA|nr:unknown [Lotus japonicus]
MSKGKHSRTNDDSNWCRNPFSQGSHKKPRNTVSSRSGARTPTMPTKQAVLRFDDPINGSKRTRASVSPSGVSPLKKDTATPVNAMAARAPISPTPAHKSQPF